VRTIRVRSVDWPLAPSICNWQLRNRLPLPCPAQHVRSRSWAPRLFKQCILWAVYRTSPSPADRGMGQSGPADREGWSRPFQCRVVRSSLSGNLAKGSAFRSSPSCARRVKENLASQTLKSSRHRPSVVTIRNTVTSLHRTFLATAVNFITPDRKATHVPPPLKSLIDTGTNLYLRLVEPPKSTKNLAYGASSDRSNPAINPSAIVAEAETRRSDRGRYCTAKGKTSEEDAP